MRKATKTVTKWFGITAGIAGMEHGYFEILRGNTVPEGLMILSIGPPCIPEEVWNACEPAMTIIPNFLITGIIALIIGLMILLWSIFFIEHKYGGGILILLSINLLLFGGGLFPPLIGFIGGMAGTKIHKPITREPHGRILNLMARIWPWPLVIFLVWVFGQWLVGSFFNDFLQEIMIYGVLLILVMLLISIFSAYAYDVNEVADLEP